jgi:hypothetical protein
MRHLIRRDISGLGSVALKPITVGVIMEAHDLTDDADENEKAAVFTNFVLANMFVEPEQSPEDVANFSAELLTSVIDTAVDVLQIREQFNEAPENLPIRERFFKAYLDHKQALFQEMSSSLARNLDAIASKALHFRKIEDTLSNAVQRMGALNLRISLPKLSSDLFPGAVQAAQMLQMGLSPAISEVMQRFEENIIDVGWMSNEPFQRIVEQITQVQLPEPYLSSALIASGLNSPILHSPSYTIPELEPIFDEEIESRAEDAQRRRLVEGYDILSQLEQSLRGLIEVKLRELHGDHWWRRGVPEDVRIGCRERKSEKEEPLEVSHHPIYYAYVHDYEKIIVRRDNWSQVFSAVFGAKNELEASFAWVGRVRDSIAHTRPVSDDDYLMFMAGTRWIQIRVRKSTGE